MRFQHLICLALVAEWVSGVAMAQQVPPAATPGGALPRVQSAVQPVAPPSNLFSIPRVYDRPLGLDEGPKLVVKSFRLAGAMDRPEHGVKVADAEAILDAAKESQPAGGYSINQLQGVAAKVATYYRDHGYILAQAFVPEQQVANGEVLVQVLEGRLGGIQVEGNKDYRAQILMRPFKSLVGAPVEKDDIESALLTLTNYPGITAFGVLGSGHDVGTTNLTLRVQNEDRFRLETVVDNHGSQFAGEYRGQVTFTYNDPLHMADKLQLVGLYAMDSDSRSGHGWYGGIDYDIPLFSPRDSLRFLHLTNTYNVGAASEVVPTDSDGRTRVDEIGYRHDFQPTRLGTASLGLAFNVKSSTFNSPPTTVFDDKLTTARADFQWDRVDTRFQGVNKFALSYTHGFKDLFGSLGDYDPNATGGASRQDATGEFNKVAAQLQRLQHLTQYTSLILRVDAQYSPDPLVSLEQFSLGGPDSVRAYPVSEFLAESGGVATVELTAGAPGFARLPAFGGRSWGQILQFSIFADYGTGTLNKPHLASQQSTFNLGGVGGSIQFSIPGRVFARLDVATPVTSHKASNGRDPQFFFSLGASF
ncbi:MAG TPA: ShlB/FhaC/HecB family hemolysin secretion/activation protein [Steroidobacteraceae bacterium]